MSSSQVEPDKSPSSPGRQTTVLLLGTIADTTWRMFVPTVALTLLGVWLDQIIHSKPICMITGIIIGSALAILLVYLQIKALSSKGKR